MIDLIKKGFLAGLGLAAMTRDKAEELVKVAMEKGEISEKEGKDLVDKLLKRSEEARKDLETKVEGIVHKALEKMNVATKDDISEIKEKIKNLEKQ
ncbi:MAG: polyhydroxyalkanoate synthesis regulator [Thermodesulfobacteriota bacterium]|nr:polyhydroxyalkanoate synthesis regulator [Thermodesulfobacteriota bacterium]